MAARLSNLPALYLLGQAATIILAHLATNGHILGVLTGPDSPYGAAGESLPLPSRGVAAAVEYTRITATRLTDGSVAGVAGGNATMQKIRAENPTSHRLKRW